MKRFLQDSLLWLMLGLLLLPLAAAAQPGSDSLSLPGTLTAARQEVGVAVQAEAGREVTLTLTSADFDPLLTVFDATGRVLHANDDNDTDIALPGAQDSALIFTPDADATLTIRVTAYTPGATGAYTLTLRGVEVLEQEAATPAPAASGNVVEGQLAAAGDRADYAFLGVSSQVITLTATSTDFDTVLEVFDDSGTQVATNDDHDDPAIPLPNRTDSALTFALESDGVYTVAVYSFDSTPGRFTLSIVGAQFGAGDAIALADMNTACDNVLGGVAAVSSHFGAGFEAERLLDSDPATSWSSRADDPTPYVVFEVAGDTPLLLNGVVFNGQAASPSFAASSVRGFEVGVAETFSTDPAAYQMVLNAEASQQAALTPYAFAPVAARYVLLRPTSNAGGGYFEAGDFNACTTLARGILSGEPPYVVSERLGDEPFLAYRLYALEGAQMTITLVSETFNPVLEVYNEAGSRLGDNDNHSDDFTLPHTWDAALHLDITQPGAVIVRVRSFAGQGGPFTLTIDGRGLQLEPPELDEANACRDVSSAAVGGSIVSSSSAFGGRWRSEYLIDGDDLSGWASGPGPESAREEYVMLDLAGDLHTVNGVRINPSATGGDNDSYNTRQFVVLVSDTTLARDAFREVLAVTLEERISHTLAFSFDPVQARYVLLLTLDTFGGRWHEVAELTVCAADS